MILQNLKIVYLHKNFKVSKIAKKLHITTKIN